ncbi:hypothetical protein EXN66_Car021511 [Channa argus]|uniref:Uncharacterized protein n=1 Tax=Channa argus TaxID=215402 RepID=A0A6G1QSX6_CHAAH|nr:hypothetical protein EXN66_Car021511 [Channa argus]
MPASQNLFTTVPNDSDSAAEESDIFLKSRRNQTSRRLILVKWAEMCYKSNVCAGSVC